MSDSFLLIIRPLKAAVLRLAVLLSLLLLGPAGLAQAGVMDFLFTAAGAPRAADVSREAPRVWKFGEFSALALQPREAGSSANQPPVKVNPETLRSRLAAIEFSAAPGRNLALFSADELNDLVPALARALATAGPGDDALLFSTARREGGFLATPLSMTARLFAADGALNLLVDNPRLDALTTFRAGRIVPSLAFGGRNAASAAQISSAAALSRRADWLVIALAEDQRMAQQPSPALVPALVPAAAAPRTAPVAEPAAPRPRDARFYDEQAQRLKGLPQLREQGVIT